MNVKKVVEYFGGRQETADALHIQTAHAVGHWVRQNRIPFTRQCQIEVVTKGTFTVAKAERKRQGRAS